VGRSFGSPNESPKPPFISRPHGVPLINNDSGYEDPDTNGAVTVAARIPAREIRAIFWGTQKTGSSV
jgi:hypothetical protein